jgi:hypothetical protein
MLDAASTVSVLVEYETSGIVRDPSVARQCRAAADFLEVMHKAASPSILRHVADRIDPRTAPAEPDLTTRKAGSPRLSVQTSGAISPPPSWARR